MNRSIAENVRMEMYLNYMLGGNRSPMSGIRLKVGYIVTSFEPFHFPQASG